MNIDGKAYRTIWLDEADRLHVIDQHVLPHRFETATITSFSALCDAIRNMLVRGAGLIGATAGYGMWLAACEAPAKDTEAFDTFMSDAATALKRTRPTASNLAWAVDRQLAAMTRGSSPEEKRHIAKVTAQAIADEDAEACKRIGNTEKRARSAGSEESGRSPRQHPDALQRGLAGLRGLRVGLTIDAAHNAGLPCMCGSTKPVPGTRCKPHGVGALPAGVPHADRGQCGRASRQHGQVDIIIVGADRLPAGRRRQQDRYYLRHWRRTTAFLLCGAPSSTFDFSLDDGVAKIPLKNAELRKSVS
ncbi:MAG: S-methyl-5-thioribose-1-phosphate isomerase [Bilophila wadsworthia]